MEYVDGMLNIRYRVKNVDDMNVEREHNMMWHCKSQLIFYPFMDVK